MSRSRLPLLLSILGFLLVLDGIQAGLEDAKHSTKLDHTNFDAQIQVPKIGTLTAFFAPWCGHCKSLLPAWDKVARMFEHDPRCRVAHFDANEAANRDIASRFSVSGFPTIKFVFKDSNEPAIDYQEARTPEAIITFLNKQCGTQRAANGLLLPEAGRVAGLDEMLTSFLTSPFSERPALVEKAVTFASTADGTMASYYVKVMNKISADESWLAKETERLRKLAEKGAAMATDKFEELQIKQNILQAFIAAQQAATSVGDKVKAAAETVKDQAEQIVEKAKGEL